MILLTFTLFSSLLAAQEIAVGTPRDFTWTALEHIGTIGAICTFSQKTQQSICEQVKKYVREKDLEKPTVLELGAGTGTLSNALIQTLNSTSTEYKLDLVELMPEFCKELKKKFERERQAKAHCGDAQTWNPGYRYNVIVSTLPFNAVGFSEKTVKNILTNIENIAEHDALFVWVEYALLPSLMSIMTFGSTQEEHIKKQVVLDEFRKKHGFKQQIIFQNMPPTYIYAQRLPLRFIVKPKHEKTNQRKITQKRKGCNNNTRP